MLVTCFYCFFTPLPKVHEDQATIFSGQILGTTAGASSGDLRKFDTWENAPGCFARKSHGNFRYDKKATKSWLEDFCELAVTKFQVGNFVKWIFSKMIGGFLGFMNIHNLR